MTDHPENASSSSGETSPNNKTSGMLDWLRERYDLSSLEYFVLFRDSGCDRNLTSPLL